MNLLYHSRVVFSQLFSAFRETSDCFRLLRFQNILVSSFPGCEIVLMFGWIGNIVLVFFENGVSQIKCKFYFVEADTRI